MEGVLLSILEFSSLGEGGKQDPKEAKDSLEDRRLNGNSLSVTEKKKKIRMKNYD